MPCSVSQSVFYGLVTTWGEAGFEGNIKNIQDHYRKQCEAMISSLRARLPSSVCEYVRPDCGMFVWLRFPSLKMSSFDLFRELADQSVITVPGDDFHVAGFGEVESSSNVPCLRVTFAAASPAQINQAVEKIAATVDRLLKTQA